MGWWGEPGLPFAFALLREGEKCHLHSLWIITSVPFSSSSSPFTLPSHLYLYLLSLSSISRHLHRSPSKLPIFIIWVAGYPTIADPGCHDCQETQLWVVQWPIHAQRGGGISTYMHSRKHGGALPGLKARIWIPASFTPILYTENSNLNKYRLTYFVRYI
jgi:hypothetical protein